MTFNFEPLVPPSLPSVAEVIANQQVYQDGAGNVLVGITERGGQVIVDGTPNEAKQAVITIATATLALHEQREKERIDKERRGLEELIKSNRAVGVNSRESVSAAQMPACVHCGKHHPADQHCYEAATSPDIGWEIAEKAVVDDAHFSGFKIVSGPIQLLLGGSHKTDSNNIIRVLASLINQGAARGAMKQWKKDDAIVRATPVTIGQERLTKNSMIVALAATEPKEIL